MSEAEFHEMREPQIAKVVVHMGVGRGGEELQRAEAILEEKVSEELIHEAVRRMIDLMVGDLLAETRRRLAALAPRRRWRLALTVAHSKGLYSPDRLPVNRARRRAVW